MKIQASEMSNWRGPVLMQKSRHFPGIITLNEKVIVLVFEARLNHSFTAAFRRVYLAYYKIIDKKGKLFENIL